MKKLSKSPWFVFFVLLSFAMLSACAGTQPVEVKGFAGGVYKNEAHRFTAEVPDNYELLTPKSGEVLRARNPAGFKLPVVTVSVGDAGADSKFDPDLIMKSAQEKNAGSKGYKVASTKTVALNDGTPGGLLVYTWTLKDGATHLETAVMWAAKGGTSISVSATGLQGASTDSLVERVSTLKFY